MARRTAKKKKKSKATKIMWGRPRSYETAEEFDKACQNYFANLKFNAPNIAGLCVSIGVSRDTWYEYRKKRGEFSDTVRSVEGLIESWWVNRLKHPGAGSIFYLKNFKPTEYKDRISGDPEAPLSMQITGMKITKEK